MASELFAITLRGAKPGDRVRLGDVYCTVVSRDSESGKLELKSDEGVSMTYLPVRRPAAED